MASPVAIKFCLLSLKSSTTLARARFCQNKMHSMSILDKNRYRHFRHFHFKRSGWCFSFCVHDFSCILVYLNLQSYHDGTSIIINGNLYFLQICIINLNSCVFCIVIVNISDKMIPEVFLEL